MSELFNIIIGILLLIGSGLFAYYSSVLVAEKKERYRAGTHDYYDRLIDKEGDDS